MLSNLVSRDLKSRYKGSILGFLWTVLTPLFMAMIYVFFLRLLARGVAMESIIVGVFSWQFTAQAVNSGLMAVSGNSNLVKKVYFPRFILPTASTFANLVNYLLSLVIQFILVAILLSLKGEAMPWTVVLVPLLVLYHTLLCLGLAYLLSAVNVFFRDAQHLVGVLLSAWFFASPVMYDLDLPIIQTFARDNPLFVNLYMLNPMAVINTGYRALILPGTSFPFHIFTVIGVLLPLVFTAVAYGVFQRMQRNFADLL
jgi:ABC-type polysaccharide/polyol phosphate export permease